MEVHNHLVVALVRLGYFYTRVEADVVIRAAKEAEWNILDPAFASLIDWFANPYTKPEGIIGIAGNVLPDIVRNATPFRVNTVISDLLTRISNRPDGTQIINAIYRRIDAMCGLDALTAHSLKELFRIWTAAR